MSELDDLLAQADKQARQEKMLVPWQAYLFASRTIRRTLRQYADAGHEWTMRLTWKGLLHKYDIDGALQTDSRVFPAKATYAAARTNAYLWLRTFVQCRRCEGKGCTYCHETGQKWYEVPLDVDIVEPSYMTDEIALTRIELADAIRLYEANAAPVRSTRLGWLLARHAYNRLTPEEAYEDYSYRDW